MLTHIYIEHENVDDAFRLGVACYMKYKYITRGVGNV